MSNRLDGSVAASLQKRKEDIEIVEGRGSVEEDPLSSLIGNIVPMIEIPNPESRIRLGILFFAYRFPNSKSHSDQKG